MQINPGGRLNTQDILGRDEEIARYWSILERQGLILSAERRIGKTHIILKMMDDCPECYISFYQDLEGIHSITELIGSIYRVVERSLDRSGRLKSSLIKWAELAPKRIGGVELPNAKDNWQALLTTVFEDLTKLAEGKVILMMWDEFPLMLYNLQRREGDDVVIELLDRLRSLRQIHAGSLRFLFTGSIGLHLVIRSLRAAGNANDPINDMLSVTVPPMGENETSELALALLEETDTDEQEIEKLAQYIAKAVGGFPYYVHHVIDQLHQLRRRIVLDDVQSAIETLMYDAQDPANFNYYLSRLNTYYTDLEQKLALIILDSIAGEELPRTNRQLINLVKHHDSNYLDEDIRAVLKLLVEDHYLVREKLEDKMCFDFRWKLVRQWWGETRL